MEKIRVSIYEDNAKLRELLEMLIGNTEGFAIAGSYPDCRQVADDIKRDQPGVVIMDIDKMHKEHPPRKDLRAL